MDKEHITQEELQRLLNYDPETGVFTWRENVGFRFKKGAVAGTKKSDGYMRIGVKRRYYAAHRLAYLYMTGSLPAKGYEMDHINRVKHDNRWSNLRAVTRSQNMANRNAWGKSGHKGIYWNHGAWQVILGKNDRVGCYKEIEEAIAIRNKAAHELYGSHYLTD